MSAQSIGDRELLRRYREGSEEAFRELVGRYVGLVYGAASSRVSGSQLREDVVQTVFLLLARKASRLRREVVLGGWLLRTTSYVARRAVRSEVRRARREEEAAMMQERTRAESEPDMMALDEAMERLRVRDRDALVLRFWQGRTLREVGGVLGTSEEAAKKRVARALDRLRQILSRRGGVMSVAVVTSMVTSAVGRAAPVGLAEAVTQAATAGAGLPSAALPELVREVMAGWFRQKVALALAAATGVAIVAFGLLSADHAGAGRGPAGEQSGQAESAEVGGPEGAAPVGGDVVAVVPVAGPAESALRLQIRDELTGEPVVGARLLAMLWRGLNRIEERDDLVTDGEGWCRLALPSDLSRLDLGVLALGYAQKSLCWRPFQGDPVPATYRLNLDRGETIGGVVVGADGAAVAGAELIIQFGDEGDAEEREPTRERRGMPTEMVVARSDARGAWWYSSLPVGRGSFWLKVYHPAFRPGVFYPETSARTARRLEDASLSMDELRIGTARLELVPGRGVAGRVVDGPGMPVAGAKVAWGANDSVYTDLDGAFRTGPFEGEPGALTVTREGYSPGFQAVELGGEEEVIITLRPAGVLRLWVVDSAGVGLDGAKVALDTWREGAWLDWWGETDLEGRVVWSSAPEGDVLDLAVFHDGHATARNVRVPVDGEEHRVVLQAVAVVTGRVVDAETGKPIPVFKAIGGHGASTPIWNRLETQGGRDGRYRVAFEDQRPPWWVRIEADGYEADWQAVEGPTCDFGLRRADPMAVVRGQVFLGAAPVEGVEVVLATLGPSPVLGAGRLLRRGDPISVRTDARGAFRFEPNPEAHSVVAIAPAGFAYERIRDPRQAMAIRLQPWGRIEGVLQARDIPVVGQVVSLAQMHPHAYPPYSVDMDSFSATTGEGGRFGLEHVPPGIYDLLVRGRVGEAMTPTLVEVNAGETTSVVVGGKGWQLRGQLLSVEECPVSDWAVQAPKAMVVSVPGMPSAPEPPEGLSRREALGWMLDYWQSPEGKERLRQERPWSYPMRVLSDGRFEVDEVPGGSYRIWLALTLLNSGTQDSPPWGTSERVVGLERELEVPRGEPEPGGEVLDYGVIQLRRP